MEEVIKGTQQCQEGIKRTIAFRRERKRLQKTVKHYAEMIEELERKLKTAQEAVATKEAALAVMTDMAANARGAEETLDHVLELLKSDFRLRADDWRNDTPDMFELRLIAFADDEEVIRDILDWTLVMDDTDMLKALRLRYCNESDNEALIQAGII